MFELRTRCALALALLLIAGGAAAHSQAAPAPLSMVPSAAEEVGRVPSHLFWLKPGLQSMQDPVDGQLVFVNDEGRVVGRTDLPRGFEIGEIVSESNRVRLIAGSGREQVIVPRAIDPAAGTLLQASAIDNGGSKRPSRLSRTSPQQLQLNDAERSGGARPLTIRSVTGATLAQAYEIGPASADTRYVVSEEIVTATPSIRVRVFVQRFDRQGRVTGAAHLSLDEMDVVPRDFVTVTDEGVLRVLMPTASGVKIREVRFSQPPLILSQGSRPSEDDLKSLGEVSGEISVDSNVIRTNDSSDPRPDGPRFKIKVATPPISRERALANARAYLTVSWVMTPENYSRPGIENLCQPAEAKFWLRPVHFSSDSLGKTIGPMPYRWGGDDTPESFKLRIAWGALAGDICTCRSAALNYCLVPESAGVDCSGFVSKAWGIEKRGTSGLLDVATELNSIADVRPGDAFVWPGRHVRLMTGQEAGAGLAYTVLESTTSLRCEGVCESSYRPSELNGYQPIKYRGMTN
jgi:hypothetical protein